MSWLQFEAMGFPRAVPGRIVSYADHNVYQVDSRNSDDHRYMQAVSRKFGAVFSSQGNGICHQVHMESFAIPGQTLLGTDSHRRSAARPACWRSARAGSTSRWRSAAARTSSRCHRSCASISTGELGPWVTAKDVILSALLRRLTSARRDRAKIFEVWRPGAPEPRRPPSA